MPVSAEDVFKKYMTSEQRDAARTRGDNLTAEYLTLQALRRARELTQVQLAEVLGKNQVSIAQLEKRSDLLLSTVRSYVEAMGGSLSLVVQFPDRGPVFLTGLSNEEALPAPSPKKEARRRQPVR